MQNFKLLLIDSSKNKVVSEEERRFLAKGQWQLRMTSYRGSLPLDYSDASWDAVIWHLEKGGDLKAVLEEAYRLVVAGGTVLLTAALNAREKAKIIRIAKALSSTYEMVPLADKKQLLRLQKLALSSNKVLKGYLDTCDVHSICGWIIDENNIHQHVEIEIIVDGKLIACVIANKFRQDLLDAGVGDGHYAFSIAMPISLLDGAEHSIDVIEKHCRYRLSGSPQVFLLPHSEYKNIEANRLTSLVDFFLKKITTRTSLSKDIIYSGLGSALEQLHEYEEAMNYYDKVSHMPYVAQRIFALSAIIGRIEIFNGKEIIGWAIRKTPIGRPVELQVFINNVYYQSIIAKKYRGDLKKLAKNYDGGQYGISLSPFIDMAGVEVSIFSLPYRLPLKNSPFKIPYIEPFYSKSEVVASRIIDGNSNSEIAIIIPIFNAVESLECCLKSVLEHTTYPARLILINDASADSRVAMILEKYKGLKLVEVLENKINLGFTRTVNKGIKLAGKADVILLNSDTIVTPRWVENLRYAVYSSAKIATATPVSDNAGAFSVPEINQPNKIPSWLEHNEYARAITQTSSRLFPSVPTGNGFCLYIRRDCLCEVGVFDETAFPRGYGEENDFCMRALQAGWNHVVDDRTIVYHKRSASFGEEKTELSAAGRDRIAQRYPEYGCLTSVFWERSDFLAIRYRIRCLFHNQIDSAIGKPRILYVISTQTGGTPQTNGDLMYGVRNEYDTWLLQCNSSVMQLLQVTEYSNSHLVESYTLQYPIDVVTHRSNEYDYILATWLVKFSIELVHVRHIAWHSLGFFTVCQRLSIPVVFSFHDFYTVCPTVNLLDGDLRYCGGTCTAVTENDCKSGLWSKNKVPQLKQRWIKQWQIMLGSALRQCDAFVTTSSSAYEVVVKTFSFLKAADFRIIPHGRSFDSMLMLGMRPLFEKRIKILVPGNINEAKGALIISALHDIDRFKLLEFHILGNAISSLTGRHIIRHGSYQRSQFAQKVDAIRPHFGAIFSICPETYCHTLSELWSVGIPVFVFDFGAVAERIRKTGGGWILPHEDIEILFKEIIKIVVSNSEYEEKLAQIALWQKNDGKNNNINAMALRYLNLYRSVQVKRRVFLIGNKKRQAQNFSKFRVAVITHGGVLDNIAPGTAHVRVLEWIHNSPYRSVEYVRCSILEILSTGCFSDYNAIFVQRNSIFPPYVDYFIDLSRRHKVPLIMEIDDDLLNVPMDKDCGGDYFLYKNTLIKLIKNSEFIMVSTDFIKQKFTKYNSNIIVRENRLSARLWFSPLVNEFKLSEHQQRNNKDEIRIVYMGSNTHAEDLMIIRGAIEKIKEKNPLIRFFVIGGESEKNNWYERIDVPENYINYPNFVQFFRSVSATMDFAIAPLADNEFNKSKSNLKFLEYAGAGLSGLYSDVCIYRKLVEESGFGSLVLNSEEGWLHALTVAISNKDIMKDQGIAVRNWVEANYTIEQKRDWFDSLFFQVSDA